MPVYLGIAACAAGLAPERIRVVEGLPNPAFTAGWYAPRVYVDAALTEFAGAHAGADLQEMRTLIRNARKEIAQSKPPRAQRELFRVLRDFPHD